MYVGVTHMSLNRVPLRVILCWSIVAVVVTAIQYICVINASPFAGYSDTRAWRQLLPSVGISIAPRVWGSVAHVVLFPLKELIQAMGRDNGRHVVSFLLPTSDVNALHVSFVLLNASIWLLCILLLGSVGRLWRVTRARRP